VTNFAGIENRTNWPNTGEITVNDAGAGLSARDWLAEAQSRPIATRADNFVTSTPLAGRLASSVR
jgi:hypothetical protein